jgi:hypothetical protein
VPGAALPPFERFEKFVGLIARVPKEEADKIGDRIADAPPKRIGKKRNVPSG